MIIEEGKFYFIKDNFFELFKEYNLMENKQNGNKMKEILIKDIE